MLSVNGEQQLKDYTKRTFEKKCMRVAENIYYFQGYGHSNATLIIGDNSCVLVDCLDSDTRGERLKQEIATITDKPVKTLIYTHGHPDHKGGAAAFGETLDEIIAHASMRPVLKHTDIISGELMRRSALQFGNILTDEELITQGLGPREGQSSGDGVYRVLPPTKIITSEDVAVLHIDGIELHLISAVGETDDTMYTWLPKEKVLCCGDNYYPCFPNLYALRGSQYRDVAEWVDSLDMILRYPVEYLLPGHGYMLEGREAVINTITIYRDAISSVLHQTLDGMAAGKTIEELATFIRLPETMRNHPVLGEHYGSVEWSVRSIYNGYAGWFDGNPSHLHTLSPKEEAMELVALAGGASKLEAALDKAMQEEKYVWAMRLCDALLQMEGDRTSIKGKKAQCCFALAKQETSSNGRHFYQTYGKALMSETEQ